jgi:amidase
LTSLGHEVVEVDLAVSIGFAGEAGMAIGTVFNAATAWIVEYWIKRIGRQPEADEIEPLTRAYWEDGKSVTGAAYLGAIEELQRFSRRVASFLAEYDTFLTPTLSTPPALIGEITSTDDDPLRAARNGGAACRLQWGDRPGSTGGASEDGAGRAGRP